MNWSDKPQGTYPVCQDPTHHGEPMNYICLEKNCTRKGLVCSLCRNTLHDNHNVMSLKVFLDNLGPSVREGNSRINQMKCLEDLEQTFHRMLTHLKATVEKLTNIIMQFQENLIKNYEQFKDRIIEQMYVTRNLEKILQLIQDSDDSAELLKLEMRKVANLVVFDKSISKYIVEYFPQTLNQHFQNQQQHIQKNLEIVRGSFQQGLKAIKNSMAKTEETMTVYKFSPTLKAKTIVVPKKQLSAKQTQSNNGDLRFAIIEPSLSNTKPSKIVFQIAKCQNWIGLGICIREIICNRNFKFIYHNIGHGSYLLSSNGFIWSHSREEDNLKHKAFTFTTNDIVTVEYLPKQKKVMYSTDKHKYQQPIDIEPGQTIHFCANLCSSNDEVRLKSEQN